MEIAAFQSAAGAVLCDLAQRKLKIEEDGMEANALQGEPNFSTPFTNWVR